MSHKQPRFSVCIPYHKNEAFLLSAVRSVAGQTYEHWELLISAEVEISSEVLRQIYTLVPGAIILKNTNKGMTNNWNHCAAQAQSSFVVLLHADDLLLPHYLDLMANMVISHEASAWFCAVELISADNKPVTTVADTIKQFIQPKGDTIKLEGDKGLASLLKGCFIYCPSVCYRTEVLTKLRFSDSWRMVADLELYARLLNKSHSIVGTRDIAFRYRRHAQNQTNILTESTVRFEEEIALYDHIAKSSDYRQFTLARNVAKRKTIIKLHISHQILVKLFTLKWYQLKSLWTLLLK